VAANNETLLFFRALFAGVPGRIEIGTDQGSQFLATPEEAAEVALKADREGRAVTFGPATRNGGEGKSKGLRATRVMWADLRFRTPTSEEDYRATLRNFENGPSIVVEHELGLVAYWLLNEPSPLQVIYDRKDFSASLATLTRGLGICPEPSSCDPKCLLPVPGSAECRLTYLDPSATYPLVALVEHAGEVIRERDGSVPRGLPLIVAMCVELAPTGEVARLLRRYPEYPEQPEEEIDRALALALARRGLPREDLWDTIEGSRKLAGLPALSDEKTREFVDGSMQQCGRPLEDWDRPEIVVNAAPRDVVRQLIQAMLRCNKDAPQVFERGNLLARILAPEDRTPDIELVDQVQLRAHLVETCDFVRIVRDTYEVVSPPLGVIAMVHRNYARRFPRLEGLVEVPVLRADGSILSEPGYDPATKLFYRPAPGLNIPPIPDEPSVDDVRLAVTLIDAALQDFPFDSDGSRATAWAAIVTPILRPAIAGPLPMVLIDAPMAGTGKGRLADVVSLVATGRRLPVMPPTTSESDLKKEITALLRNGPPVALIDNLVERLTSANLAALLTSEEWQGRLLGHSKMLILPNRALWIATGNNLQLGGDLPRRSIYCRIDARVERPQEREGFAISDLRAWVLANRGHLVAAVLTLARAWIVAGRPGPSEGMPQLGSFERWREVVGGVLMVAGMPKLLANQVEMYETVDTEAEQWAAFFAAWYSWAGTRLMTTKELALEAPRAVRDAGPDGVCLENIDSAKRSLGNALRRRHGCRFGGYLLRRGSKVEGKTQSPRYQVLPAR